MTSINHLMKTYSKTIDGMDERAQKETLLFVGVLADPLTRRIMAKLTNKHGPITVNNVPTDLLKATKSQVISRLCRLERYGLVTSKKHISSGEFFKEYSINESGRRWVHE